MSGKVGKKKQNIINDSVNSNHYWHGASEFGEDLKYDHKHLFF